LGNKKIQRMLKGDKEEFAKEWGSMGQQAY
jgi:hypothetical protein